METDPKRVENQRWSKRNCLWTKGYVELPVFSTGILTEVEALLRAVLPDWSTGLSLARHSDAKRTRVDAGALHAVVNAVCSTREGLGSAVLTGSYKGVQVFLDSWIKTVPPELNMISVEVTGVSRLEGDEPANRVGRLLSESASRLPLRYGHAYEVSEFDAKNMAKELGSARVIGGNLSDGLPGLYWLNYFGAPYSRLWGAAKLALAPAASVQALNKGALLALGTSPLMWRSDDYREIEARVRAYLGPEHLFDRGTPDRRLVAPVFAAPEGQVPEIV